MREILFRGKTTSKELPIREFNNIWVEGDLIKNGNKFFIHPHGNVFRTEHEIAKLMACHEVIPETVGQFTGLTDKNGTKIFEGDIIQGTIVSAWNKALIRCEVVYNKDGFISVERTRNQDRVHKVKFAKDIEVIGNIHDQSIEELTQNY